MEATNVETYRLQSLCKLIFAKERDANQGLGTNGGVTYVVRGAITSNGECTFGYDAEEYIGIGSDSDTRAYNEGIGYVLVLGERNGIFGTNYTSHYQ